MMNYWKKIIKFGIKLAIPLKGLDSEPVYNEKKFKN